MRRESAKNTFAWALFVVLIVTLVLVTPTCEAANHFVRGAARDAATGADWTNAFTDLPAHLTRGDVYYVAVGTYSHHLFNDAVSGTSVIEIRAATTADHGAATDWQTTFQGEALFSPTGTGTPDGAVFEFLTDYYLINGNGVRNADWQGGYLIRASDRNKLASESVVLISQRSTFVHDITIDYVNMEGSYAAVDTDNHEQAFESRCGAANVAVRHSYLHDTGADIMFIKGRHDTTGSSALCNAASNGAQMTIEYNYLARDYSSSALHGQGLECDEGQYCVIRYNRFRDIGGTAFIATPSGGGRLWKNIRNLWGICRNKF